MKLKFALAGFLVFAAIAAVTLAALEGVSRWWVMHRADALQRARRTMVLDQARGWRHASSLDTTFEGVPLWTDTEGFRTAKPGEATRDMPSEPALAPTTIVLGPSSAFGWGVEFKEAWPALLEKNYGPVLNASQVGYSLVQGRALFGALPANRRTALRNVVLAYGVNDVDRFRFFGSDGRDDLEHFASAEPVSSLASLANSFSFTSLLWRAGEESRLYRACGLAREPAYRLAPERFASFLADFLDELSKQGLRPFLVNSAREMPFEPDDAKASLADRFFTESAARSRENDCAGSRRLFAQARENEPWRVLRDIDRINNVIKKVAAERHVPMADIATALVSPTKGRLFVDPIHPSAEGHRLAASVINEMLRSAPRESK